MDGKRFVAGPDTGSICAGKYSRAIRRGPGRVDVLMYGRIGTGHWRDLGASFRGGSSNRSFLCRTQSRAYLSTHSSFDPRLVPAQLAASTIGFIVSASIIGLALFPWLAGILIQFAGSWSLLPFILGLTGIMGIFWQYTTRLLAKAPLSAMVEFQNEKV